MPLSEQKSMIGRFHLGLNYDMLLWMNNTECGVFPCQEEVMVPVERRDAQGNVTWIKKRQISDIAIVVTESCFLKLKIDPKVKNVAKLVAWATLPALETIKHSLEYSEQLSISFRSIKQGVKPWVLHVQMHQNSQDCIALIRRRLKQHGIQAQKGFDKKRKIRESEVTQGAMSELKIDTLLKTIEEWENKLALEKSS